MKDELEPSLAEPVLVTVAEAAQALLVSTQTLLKPKWRRKVGLPLVIVGGQRRFRWSDLKRLVERGREFDPLLVRPEPIFPAELDGDECDDEPMDAA